MKQYKDFQPTGFDCKGLGLPDRQDWFVAPVSQTRDSGSLDQSNFAAALRILGGESETCEVHRFGHWGPGWYEIIIVSPERLAELEELEGSLEDYPVLDESDLSTREHEDYMQAWSSFGWKEFIDALKREFQLEIETVYRLQDISEDALLTWYESLVPSGDYYSESYGFRFDSAMRDLSRGEVAEWIRGNKVARHA
jgi:hypothetical protein